MDHGNARADALRRGFTLLEMLVVLALTSLVLGIVSIVGSRLHRELAGATGQIAAREQLATAAAILPLDLRSLSPPAGDIRQGEARDTALEMRSVIASGATCGGTPTAPNVVPLLAEGGRHVTPSIEPGDTLWILDDGDVGEGWTPIPIRALHSVAGTCGALAIGPGRDVFDSQRLIGVDLRDSITGRTGSFVRITRPIRYSIYRASDGLWYLGLRTWSSGSVQFNGVQPLSGPYDPPGLGGTRAEYFDSAGNAVTSGALNTRDIARIEWLLRSSASVRGLPVRDSTRLVIAIRNRR